MGKRVKTEKNVLILAMSTLNFYKGVQGVLLGNRFTYSGCENTGENIYYSQLEPISKMIREREGSLDYVIVLATEEARKPIEAGAEYEKELQQSMPSGIPNDGCAGMSAVTYYQSRLQLPDEALGIVELNHSADNSGEADIIPAIHEAVSLIREYWKKEGKNNLHLWVDTQGALREINLVMNAVLSLLGSTDADNRIVPEGRYSVAFDRSKQNQGLAQEIKDQTKTYQMFDFVSGINELTAYGRADQLYEYYKDRKGIALEIVEQMKKIAEAIQICNVGKFDQYLQELCAKWKLLKENKMDDALIGIFVEQIENDYGNLLKEEGCELDVIQWLSRKKFYQQALTYIESRMPEFWRRSGLWDFQEACDMALSGKCGTIKAQYIKTENFLLYEMHDKIFGNSKLILHSEDNKRIADRIEERVQRVNQRSKRLFEICYRDSKEGPVKRCNCSIELEPERKETFFKEMLLYRSLKNERNSLNHMSESTDEMAEEREIKGAINLFVKWGRELQQQEPVSK